MKKVFIDFDFAKNRGATMNAKKKFVLILSLLSVVFIITTVTLVVVLTAKFQSAKAVIKVKYQATKVSAELSARYRIDGEVDEEGNQVIHDMYIEENGVINMDETVITFGPNEESSGILVPESDVLALTRDNREIIFEFCIENLSDSIVMDVSSTDLPTYGGEGDDVYNVRVNKYYTSAVDSILDNPDTIRDNSSALLVEGVQAQIQPKNCFRIYIIVTIADALYNASYAGNIVWSLTRAE